MSPVSPINQTAPDESVYVLTYRDGIQSLPIFGFVRFNSSVPMRSIVEKCQTYCRRHHFRYVSVRPCFIDVLEEESTGEVFLRTQEGPQVEQRDGSVNHHNNPGSRNNNRSTNQANVETVKS
jgi:hypothetical protein